MITAAWVAPEKLLPAAYEAVLAIWHDSRVGWALVTETEWWTCDETGVALAPTLAPSFWTHAPIRYVIVKKTRDYRGGWGYSGPTCQSADVDPGLVYADEDIAKEDAALLSARNPVGFRVERYLPQIRERRSA